jgi:hypothetical protein
MFLNNYNVDELFAVLAAKSTTDITQEDFANSLGKKVP